MFTEANPDKGTETPTYEPNGEPYISLQKLTPIRGRKQGADGNFDVYKGKSLQKLTPIRGRKRRLFMVRKPAFLRLQKLTPIRGRKQSWQRVQYYFFFGFTEANPDKGTETIKIGMITSPQTSVYRS